jgi:D-erythronate 2-dehydrogenase
LKVLVTGAAGFVGRALLQRLRPHHQLVALDRHPPDVDCADCITGDLTDHGIVANLREHGFEAVVHLATMPGGAAERDPESAWRVNVDATRRLFDAMALSAQPVRIVYASSIAVFGDPLPADLHEDSPVAPTLLYGAHKAMMEQWLGTLTRRGQVHGMSVRLPGIVARPRAPAGLKSAFLSDVVHALRAGEPIELPVSRAATTLLMSVDLAAANLQHALEHRAVGTVTLPALRVQVGEYVDAIAAAAGVDARHVQWTPDAVIEAQFGRWPELYTPRALALGFAREAGIQELVRSTLSAALGNDSPA